MVGRQLWPFPSTSNSFYWPSELTRMQFHEQQLEDSSQLSMIHNISDVSRAQSPISVASTALHPYSERRKGQRVRQRKLDQNQLIGLTTRLKIFWKSGGPGITSFKAPLKRKRSKYGMKFIHLTRMPFPRAREPFNRSRNANRIWSTSINI